MAARSTPSAPRSSAPSGSTWASGTANTQASGTPVVYAQYEQWSEFEFTRNPDFGVPQDLASFRNLTTASSTDIVDIKNTKLHSVITVHNSCKFVSGNFTVSSHYQPQKFTVMSNEYDKVGYSYGPVSGASSLYVFGPQGKIITSQPMIRRNLSSADDFEYTMTQTGSTAALQVLGSLPSEPPNHDQRYEKCDDIGQSYDYYLKMSNDNQDGSSLPQVHHNVGGSNMFGMYGGGYSTSSEPGFEDNTVGLEVLINYIEANVKTFSNPMFHNRLNKPFPLYSNGSSFIVEADRVEINPYYDSIYHDYNG
jgi:hypothetical protein